MRRPALASALCCALSLALLLPACGGPSDVANQFIDRYYVESDQTSALPIAAGVALLRLQDELRLSAEGRSAGAPLPSRQVRVYYQRLRLEGQGDGPGAQRTADYSLDIRPQGGGALTREAHLTLEKQPGGWKVVRFSEGAAR